MWKIIETAILWACLPFVFLAFLALVINATWSAVLIGLLVLASPVIAGFVYGLFLYDDDYGKYEEAKRQRQDADAIHRAMLPGRPDDVQPGDAAAPLKPLPAPPKALPAPYGHQWRGRLK